MAKKATKTMVMVSQLGTFLRRSQSTTGLRPMTTNKPTRTRFTTPAA
jgi:hypothetical protein